jgi:hypothetical protein
MATSLVMDPGYNDSLYFYTGFVAMQAVCIKICAVLVHSGCPSAKRLKALSFVPNQVIILGFPLPTPVLTPGWAII